MGANESVEGVPEGDVNPGDNPDQSFSGNVDEKKKVKFEGDIDEDDGKKFKPNDSCILGLKMGEKSSTDIEGKVTKWYEVITDPN